MAWIVGYVGYVIWVWLLSKPAYSLSEAMFWASMELAAIRDPHIHDAAVTLCTGVNPKYDPTL